MPVLRVYSRQGCHLCEQLIEELTPLIRDRAELEVCDIDSRDDWKVRFNTEIPVLEYDGEAICQYHLDRAALARVLDRITA